MGDRVGGDGYVRVSEKVEERLMIIDDEYIRMIRGEKVRTIFPLIIELVILLLLFNSLCWDMGKLNYWMASGAIGIYLFLPGVPFTKKRREKRKKREYLAMLLHYQGRQPSRVQGVHRLHSFSVQSESSNHKGVP